MTEPNRSITPARPAVSVVVPCRNEVLHIESCVRSLLQQEEPQGGFEIVVADGMSDDGTRAILSKMAAEDSRLRVVDNPSRITPCGMNRGIRDSRGRWIAIMGSHNRYANDYLIRCMETARATGADNVGGAMFTEGKSGIQRAIAAAHHSRFSVGGARWHNPDYEGPADTVFGGFYKREVFDKIGLFDEELVRNQDDEFNLRLSRSGGRIWQSPQVKSWYQPRTSLSALFRQYKQYGYWKVRVIQKHKLPASWRHLVPGVFVFILGALGFSTILALLVSALTSLSNLPAVIFALCLGVCFGAYFFVALVAAVLSGRKAGWSILPALPFVFMCYHFGYGYGFLRGAWDFLVCKKKPARQFVELTRVEASQKDKSLISSIEGRTNGQSLEDQPGN